MCICFRESCLCVSVSGSDVCVYLFQGVMYMCICFRE